MANQIVQHQYQDFSIPQRAGDGYVSLTKMAAAYPSKRMSDFLRSESTKSYLQALSENTAIPVFKLLESKQGRNGGTWAHPEVSVKFAAWLSPEFEVWAMRTLVKIISENAGDSTKADATDLADLAKSEAIANTVKSLLSGTQLGSTERESKNLTAGIALSVVGSRHPELKEELMIAHKALAAATPSETLLTPTTIGKRMGMSARTINSLLIDMGLQVRIPSVLRSKGEPAYRATELGQEHSANTMASGNAGDMSSYQHLKWKESVVALISNKQQEIA